jgi:hypothetical protein
LDLFDFAHASDLDLDFDLLIGSNNGTDGFESHCFCSLICS